ncbi:hypothetical protein H1P_250035 [Hyella patelloides LEGE 07179]|uniref:Uncharacterized protein n=1 Tax=Hyella patelloides LEGE 07179 TaxID=945734 RepID=A0A563VS56_9CYAN|nr:hypothetical protein [Hyella patelloides]VEP14243.1 hypothetical protein H1P_250035 [Hyella patelloides LEGE 07179]
MRDLVSWIKLSVQTNLQFNSISPTIFDKWDDFDSPQLLNNEALINNEA